jgi:hypothetical protein
LIAGKFEKLTMQNPKEISRIERLAALKNIKSPPPPQKYCFYKGDQRTSETNFSC